MSAAIYRVRSSVARLLLTGLILCVGAVAQLTSTPASLAFSNTYVGLTTVSKTITIKNTGTASVTINSITSSCTEFKLASGTVPYTLAAGKTYQYSMNFNPLAAQAYSCNYTLAATGASNLVVPMTGTGLASTAVVSSSPTSLTFSNVPQGTTSASQTITVSNTGTGTVKINSITIVPATFAYTSATLPISLAKNKSTTITVTYNPQLVTSETGVIAFTFSNIPNQVVDLSGSSVAPSSLEIANTPTLPAATIGFSYQAQLNGLSGTAPYTFSLASGSTLPSGLSLSSAGLISGSVGSSVTAGTYNFSVQVTDSKSKNATKAFNMVIGKATGAACNNISYDISGTSSPLVDLPDLGTGSYLSEEGGLYPNGSNVRPASHDADGVTFADGIVPLDSNGDYSPTGKYVLLGVGESVALDEYGQFLQFARYDPSLNANLVLVDGAQGGATPNLLTTATSSYWTTILQNYLPDQGVDANQVVAMWIDDTNGYDSGTFPSDMTSMQANYESMMNTVHTLFPNLKLVYFASRIYAGYSDGVATIDPEPWAYQEGYAIKWAIQDQLNGNSNLNYNSANGPVEAPWMSWGNYDWANGLLPNSDGTVWTCQDLQKDGTHPATPGDIKVAGRLLNFLKNDDTTTPWFLKK